MPDKAREYTEEYREYRQNKMRDIFGLSDQEYRAFQYYFNGDQQVDIAGHLGVNTVTAGILLDKARQKIGANLSRRPIQRAVHKVEALLTELSDLLE